MGEIACLLRIAHTAADKRDGMPMFWADWRRKHNTNVITTNNNHQLKNALLISVFISDFVRLFTEKNRACGSNS